MLKTPGLSSLFVPPPPPVVGMAMEPARKKASPPHKTAIVILIAFALFCISSLTLVTSCWYSATNTNFEGLPSGVLASPTSSNYVWRFLAPDVAAALAAELKQQHVTSVALLRCDINSTITNSFAIVGVIPTCIKKLADVDQYLRSYAPGMGAPRAAIVRLRHDRAAEDLSTSLLEAQLLSAAPGGSNAVAFGEISYGNTTTPLRAILLHPHGKRMAPGSSRFPPSSLHASSPPSPLVFRATPEPSLLQSS